MSSVDAALESVSSADAFLSASPPPADVCKLVFAATKAPRAPAPHLYAAAAGASHLLARAPRPPSLFAERSALQAAGALLAAGAVLPALVLLGGALRSLGGSAPDTRSAAAAAALRDAGGGRTTADGAGALSQALTAACADLPSAAAGITSAEVARLVLGAGALLTRATSAFVERCAVDADAEGGDGDGCASAAHAIAHALPPALARLASWVSALARVVERGGGGGSGAATAPALSSTDVAALATAVSSAISGVHSALWRSADAVLRARPLSLELRTVAIEWLCVTASSSTDERAVLGKVLAASRSAAARGRRSGSESADDTAPPATSAFEDSLAVGGLAWDMPSSGRVHASARGEVLHFARVANAVRASFPFPWEARPSVAWASVGATPLALHDGFFTWALDYAGAARRAGDAAGAASVVRGLAAYASRCGDGALSSAVANAAGALDGMIAAGGSSTESSSDAALCDGRAPSPAWAAAVAEGAVATRALVAAATHKTSPLATSGASARRVVDVLERVLVWACERPAAALGWASLATKFAAASEAEEAAAVPAAAASSVSRARTPPPAATAATKALPGKAAPAKAVRAAPAREPAPPRAMDSNSFRVESANQPSPIAPLPAVTIGLDVGFALSQGKAGGASAAASAPPSDWWLLLEQASLAVARAALGMSSADPGAGEGMEIIERAAAARAAAADGRPAVAAAAAAFVVALRARLVRVHLAAAGVQGPAAAAPAAAGSAGSASKVKAAAAVQVAVQPSTKALRRAEALLSAARLGAAASVTPGSTPVLADAAGVAAAALSLAGADGLHHFKRAAAHAASVAAAAAALGGSSGLAIVEAATTALHSAAVPLATAALDGAAGAPFSVAAATLLHAEIYAWRTWLASATIAASADASTSLALLAESVDAAHLSTTRALASLCDGPSRGMQNAAAALADAALEVAVGIPFTAAVGDGAGSADDTALAAAVAVPPSSHSAPSPVPSALAAAAARALHVLVEGISAAAVRHPALAAAIALTQNSNNAAAAATDARARAADLGRALAAARTTAVAAVSDAVKTPNAKALGVLTAVAFVRVIGILGVRAVTVTARLSRDAIASTAALWLVCIAGVARTDGAGLRKADAALVALEAARSASAVVGAVATSTARAAAREVRAAPADATVRDSDAAANASDESDADDFSEKEDGAPSAGVGSSSLSGGATDDATSRSACLACAPRTLAAVAVAAGGIIAADAAAVARSITLASLCSPCSCRSASDATAACAAAISELTDAAIVCAPPADASDAELAAVCVASLARPLVAPHPLPFLAASLAARIDGAALPQPLRIAIRTLALACVAASTSAAGAVDADDARLTALETSTSAVRDALDAGDRASTALPRSARRYISSLADALAHSGAASIARGGLAVSAACADAVAAHEAIAAGSWARSAASRSRVERNASSRFTLPGDGVGEATLGTLALAAAAAAWAARGEPARAWWAWRESAKNASTVGVGGAVAAALAQPSLAVIATAAARESAALCADATLAQAPTPLTAGAATSPVAALVSALADARAVASVERAARLDGCAPADAASTTDECARSRHSALRSGRDVLHAAATAASVARAATPAMAAAVGNALARVARLLAESPSPADVREGSYEAAAVAACAGDWVRARANARAAIVSLTSPCPPRATTAPSAPYPRALDAAAIFAPPATDLPDALKLFSAATAKSGRPPLSASDSREAAQSLLLSIGLSSQAASLRILRSRIAAGVDDSARGGVDTDADAISDASGAPTPASFQGAAAATRLLALRSGASGCPPHAGSAACSRCVVRLVADELDGIARIAALFSATPTRTSPPVPVKLPWPRAALALEPLSLDLLIATAASDAATHSVVVAPLGGRALGVAVGEQRAILEAAGASAAVTTAATAEAAAAGGPALAATSAAAGVAGAASSRSGARSRANSASSVSSAAATSDATKAAWWAARHALDDRLKALCASLAALVKSTLSPLRAPVLVLSGEAARFPWEAAVWVSTAAGATRVSHDAIPRVGGLALRTFAVAATTAVTARAPPPTPPPSAVRVWSTLIAHGAALAPASLGTLPSRGVAWVVNPAGDLPRTAEALAGPLAALVFATGAERALLSSEGAPAPPPARVLAALSSSDAYIYAGHGAGEAIVNRTLIARARGGVRAAALLLGCSSARPATAPAQHAHSTAPSDSAADMYVLAGAPLAVGFLWDVTDRDCDRLSVELLHALCGSDGLDVAAVASALPVARNATRLPFLTGAAPVVIGLARADE